MSKNKYTYEPAGEERMRITGNMFESTIHIAPPKSPWQCQLGGPMGIVFVPNLGNEPRWFHRKMQELFFGVKWVKK